jgi:hypothetical protein
MAGTDVEARPVATSILSLQLDDLEAGRDSLCVALLKTLTLLFLVALFLLAQAEARTAPACVGFETRWLRDQQYLSYPVLP